MVRHYWAIKGQPNKKVIISRKNGYHGSTVAGASLGGMTYMHEQGDLPIPGIFHIAQPYWSEFAQVTESRVTSEGFAPVPSQRCTMRSFRTPSIVSNRTSRRQMSRATCAPSFSDERR